MVATSGASGAEQGCGVGLWVGRDVWWFPKLGERAGFVCWAHSGGWAGGSLAAGAGSMWEGGGPLWMRN